MRTQRWRQDFFNTPVGEIHVFVLIAACLLAVWSVVEGKHDPVSSVLGVLMVAIVANKALVWWNRHWVMMFDQLSWGYVGEQTASGHG
jgi:hypothetical protein